jgi:trimethylamine--corrinoid protein Co-methyltransferase
MFTDDELVALHLATLETLSHTGVLVEKKEARDLFESNGAKVEKNGTVRLSTWLIEESIRAAPPRLTLAGRMAYRDCAVESGRVNFSCFGEGTLYNDPFSSEYRQSTKKDLTEATKIIDALDVIPISRCCVTSLNVPEPVRPLHNYEAMLNITAKPVFISPGNGRNLKIILEMARAACGEERLATAGPPVSFVTSPVSPLRLNEDCCDVIITAAREDAAVCVLSGAMSGGSAPINPAGTLVILNSEVLAGIVLAQLVRKGAKVVYGSSTTAINLKQATACSGSPEPAMLNAAVASLAKFYGLPSWVAGGKADSKLPDAQSGHEKTLTGLLPALAGANVIYGLGMMEMGGGFSPEQLLVDADLASMIHHTIAGFPVNDQTLSLDLIFENGHRRAFSRHPDTRRNRFILSAPLLIDRRSRIKWQEDSGGLDIFQRAKKLFLELNADYQGEPLPAEAGARVRSLVTDAEKNLGFAESRA